MNAVPAMSEMNVNVPLPVASWPPQTSAPGTPSKFQDLYQNLPSMQNQSQEDGQQADSKNVVVKKKSPSSDDGSAVAVTPVAANNAALPNTSLALTLALGLTSQPAATERLSDPAISPIPSPAPVPAVVTKLTPASSPTIIIGDPTQSQARNLSGQASTIQIQPPSLNLPPASQPSKPNRTADLKTSDAPDVHLAPAPEPRTMPTPSSGAIATLNGAPQVSIPAPPAPIPNENDRRLVQASTDEQPAESRVSPAATSSDPVTTTNPAQSFPLSAGNLAFAMQLVKSNSQPDALANPEAGTRPTDSGTILAATPIAQPSTTDTQPASIIIQLPAGSESKMPLAASTVSNPAPSSSVPNVTNLPAGPSHSGSAATPETRAFGKPEPTSSESTNVAKPETSAPGQVSTDSPTLARPVTLNHSSSTLYQPMPGSAGELGALAHVDPGPSMNLADQPAAALPPATPPAQLQALNLAPPRTNASNDILLNLGNGQTSAAVRVVDRAGTITVSVHATDQDLRNSLRTSLSDLTTQLSAQGVKTEVVKTASAQSSAESRQEQPSQQQRGSSQQHSLSENDRQSQRDRRGNSQWLEELTKQTSASIVKPGGKTS
jgi:hypothetical protein